MKQTILAQVDIECSGKNNVRCGAPRVRCKRNLCGGYCTEFYEELKPMAPNGYYRCQKCLDSKRVETEQ